MVKRIFYHLIFIPLMIFCFTQSVFAGFNITVVNESGVEYDNLDLVITSVGFDAMYGTISLSDIGLGRTPRSVIYNYEYLKVPLTGTGMPPSLEECNLDLMVIAGPKRASETILNRTFSKIVTSPRMITEDEPRKYPSQAPMKGIQPPNIKIRG